MAADFQRIGQELYRQRRLGAAARAFRVAVAVDPAAQEPLHSLGIVEYERRGLAAAWPLLQQAVRLVPDDPKILYSLDRVQRETFNRAAVAANAGDFADSLWRFAPLRRVCPEYGPLAYVWPLILGHAGQRAQQAGQDGHLAEALRICTALSECMPEHAGARANVDNVHTVLLSTAAGESEAGRFEAARDNCRRILELWPDDVSTLHLLAIAERRAGNAAVALSLMIRTLVLDPQIEGGHHNLVSCLETAVTLVLDHVRKGRAAEAILLYGTIRRADPDATVGRNGPALMWHVLNRTANADMALRQAEAEALAWLGTRNIEVRRFDRAIDQLGQAVQASGAAVYMQEWGRAYQLQAQEMLIGSLKQNGFAWLTDFSRTQARAVFDALHPHVEALLELETTDSWTRTQHWSALCSLRAFVAYADAAGVSPFAGPTLPSPFADTRPAVRGSRRVFDCFTFFNELELLEIRLAELHGVVEKFVLVEATRTHSGQPKDLIFAAERERFKPYLDKIVHVVVDDVVDGFAWQREAQQREWIARGLTEARDGDMVIVSDVDEILRRDVALRLTGDEPEVEQVFTPELDLFFYFLNFRFGRRWRAASVVPATLIRRIGTNHPRYLGRQGVGHVIPRAGWHFSWMGGAERVLSKLRAYAHQEHEERFSSQVSGNADRIARFLDGGGTLPVPDCGPGADGSYERIAIDATYPRLVVEDLERFQNLGWVR